MELIASRSNDLETGDEFKKNMERTVASGALAMSLAIGVQLGLFQAMSELKVPASPTYIAKVADCNERFLREWLFHMVTGGVIEVDTSNGRYWLPVHRSRVLLTEGAVDLATFIPSMGKMYDGLIHSFKTGNTSGAIFNLPDTDFCKRWEKRGADGSQALIDVLTHYVPELQQRLEKGINFLDIGCGRGHFLFAMARRFPDSLFTGVDINDNLISDARDRARSIILEDMSLTNIGFAGYDAAILPDEWTGRFDVVMMNEVVYGLPSLADVLWEVKSPLNQDGILMIVDRCIHINPEENLSTHAQRITSLITPVVSMNYNLPVALSQPEGDSEALGTCSGKEKLIEAIEDAGYIDVESFQFSLDEQKVQVLIVAKKEPDSGLELPPGLLSKLPSSR